MTTVIKAISDTDTVHVRTSGTGIGDAVAALYACCGAAKAGVKVLFHTNKSEWLTYASYPGVQIVTNDLHVGVDVNPDYDLQLQWRAVRKQWYCDNLATAIGCTKFKPCAPNISRSYEKPDTAKVLLFPFANYRSREWPSSHWSRLAIILRDRGYSVTAMGGTGKGKELSEMFNGTGAEYHWGSPIEEVRERMFQTSCVIGNDSGMVHLSGMLGIPTIAIHAQVMAKQLWDCTEVIGVMPDKTIACAGCNWQEERGYVKTICQYDCSALKTISPQRVADVVGEVV